MLHVYDPSLHPAKGPANGAKHSAKNGAMCVYYLTKGRTTAGAKYMLAWFQILCK
jgi:hypothetical protein